MLFKREADTHVTRIRALVPRILAAYDALNEEDKLLAARAAASRVKNSESVKSALAKIGWELQEGELSISELDLREMFFPKGSQWDAFVVLRDIFNEVQAELTIIDAYCDGTIFQILSGQEPTNLKVKILCSKYAVAVAAEAKTFVAQFPNVAIEVRKTLDFHDRFIVVDGQSCIHIGASIKDAGKTAFMISRIEDYQNRDSLLAALKASWNAATDVS
jgi:hypothetical protein